jgi:hypothetical protein
LFIIVLCVKWWINMVNCLVFSMVSDTFWLPYKVTKKYWDRQMFPRLFLWKRAVPLCLFRCLDKYFLQISSLFLCLLKKISYFCICEPQ